MPDVDNSPDPKGNGGQDPNNPGKEFVPPSDGSWVPRDRLNTELAAERRRTEAVEGSLEELKREVAGLKPQVKVYSEQELQAYVDGGQITEAQMHSALRTQDNNALRSTLKSEITSELRTETKDQQNSAAIAAYTAKVPDVEVDGTDASNRVTKAYNFLVDECDVPKGKGAMVAALRQVYGPVETLQLKGSPVVETFHETGGGGGSPKVSTEGKPELTSAQDAYYSGMVGTQRYPTWKDVENELKYANKSVVARNAAR